MTPAVGTLAKIDLLRSLSPDEICVLDSRCIWRKAKAREWILEYRDESTEVFFLTAGSVRVLIQSSDGRETIIRDIQAGDFFGELAAIDGKNRSAGILTLTDATIARMQASTFVDTVLSHSRIVKDILLRMTAQTRALGDRVHEFNAMGIRERLLAALLRMGHVEDGEGTRVLISPPPTHGHLAGLIGTRRDSVSRELRLMRKMGLLEIRRGVLVLPDVQRVLHEIETRR
jgi:CRP/FNR family cyclic AMP-dependent transcriptional regulator